MQRGEYGGTGAWSAQDPMQGGVGEDLGDLPGLRGGWERGGPERGWKGHVSDGEGAVERESGLVLGGGNHGGRAVDAVDVGGGSLETLGERKSQDAV